MNVLRPKIDATVRLPIFLWVHGGSYKHGNGSGEIWGDMMQYDGRFVFLFETRTGFPCYAKTWGFRRFSYNFRYLSQKIVNSTFVKIIFGKENYCQSKSALKENQFAP